MELNGKVAIVTGGAVRGISETPEVSVSIRPRGSPCGREAVASRQAIRGVNLGQDVIIL